MGMRKNKKHRVKSCKISSSTLKAPYWSDLLPKCIEHALCFFTSILFENQEKKETINSPEQIKNKTTRRCICTKSKDHTNNQTCTKHPKNQTPSMTILGYSQIPVTAYSKTKAWL